MSDFNSSQVYVGLSKEGGKFVVSVGENGDIKKRTFADEHAATRFKEDEEKRLKLK